MEPLSTIDRRKAGLALAALAAFDDPRSAVPRGATAALIASMTADGLHRKMYAAFAGQQAQLTLLFVLEDRAGPPKTALLPRAFQDYDEAVRFWLAYGTNLLLPGAVEEPWPDYMMAVIRNRVRHWTEQEQSPPLRWAAAAHAVGEDAANKRPGPAALDGFWDLASDGDCSPTELLRDVARVWTEANRLRGDLPRLAERCLLRRSPLLIPADVFRNRGGLAPMQALCWYLVEDRFGPGLTHAEAATITGMNTRQEVGKHIRRVRFATDGAGPPAVRPDLSLPPMPPPSMLVADVSLRGDPTRIPRLGRR